VSQRIVLFPGKTKQGPGLLSRTFGYASIKNQAYS